MTTDPAADPTTDASTHLEGERADLLETLRRHRGFLLHTVKDLDEDQARTRSTTSALTLGSLVKHVAQTERTWADFVVDGPPERSAIDWSAIDWSNPPAEVLEFQAGHTMLETETLPQLLEDYAAVAARTDALVASVDLDARQPLPEAPWFEAGASWSARRVLLHVIAETSQHAGHADIIRESLDGQLTMG